MNAKRIPSYCYAVDENEFSLFPIGINKVPIIGDSLKLSLTDNTNI